jgi:hypothetical protein
LCQATKIPRFVLKSHLPSSQQQTHRHLLIYVAPFQDAFVPLVYCHIPSLLSNSIHIIIARSTMQFNPHVTLRLCIVMDAVVALAIHRNNTYVSLSAHNEDRSEWSKESIFALLGVGVAVLCCCFSLAWPAFRAWLCKRRPIKCKYVATKVLSIRPNKSGQHLPQQTCHYRSSSTCEDRNAGDGTRLRLGSDSRISIRSCLY